MTFSQEVKNEICKHSFGCPNCRRAMLYGMLYCCKGIKEDSITIYMENRTIVSFFTQNLIDLTAPIVTVKEPDFNNKRIHDFFTITIEDKNDIDSIIDVFFGDINDKSLLNEEILEEECCCVWFFRGAFLLSGTIVDPKKEYHLEISATTEDIADNLLYVLSQLSLDFKLTNRAKKYAIYLKESSKIEDSLTILGATSSNFKLINSKIEKEMRNNINRATNCETANIDKIVNASVVQIQKIQLIRDTIGFDQLKPELQEVALLRLMSPELSLNELCELSGNKLTKSGLNYRLKKLIEIADKIEIEED